MAWLASAVARDRQPPALMTTAYVASGRDALEVNSNRAASLVEEFARRHLASGCNLDASR